MNRVLKILGIAVLMVMIFIFVAILLLKHISSLPTPPENYRDKLETGGEIEAKYLMNGKMAVILTTATVLWSEFLRPCCKKLLRLTKRKHFTKQSVTNRPYNEAVR